MISCQYFLSALRVVLVLFAPTIASLEEVTKPSHQVGNNSTSIDGDGDAAEDGKPNEIDLGLILSILVPTVIVSLAFVLSICIYKRFKMNVGNIFVRMKMEMKVIHVQEKIAKQNYINWHNQKLALGAKKLKLPQNEANLK